MRAAPLLRADESYGEAVINYRCDLAALQSAAVTNFSDGSVRVGIGGYPHEDSCLAVDRVEQKKIGGAEPIIRDRPSRDGRALATLHANQYFWIGDTNCDGGWTDILFPHQSDGQIACGVSSPIAKRITYDGPRLRGWVQSKLIRVYAG